jgi:hypothetical protein
MRWSTLEAMRFPSMKVCRLKRVEPPLVWQPRERTLPGTNNPERELAWRTPAGDGFVGGVQEGGKFLRQHVLRPTTRATRSFPLDVIGTVSASLQVSATHNSSKTQNSSTGSVLKLCAWGRVFEPHHLRPTHHLVICVTGGPRPPSWRNHPTIKQRSICRTDAGTNIFRVPLGA